MTALIQTAIQMMDKARSPYSNYRVGAAVETIENKIIGGKKILSETISVQTVESKIAKSLEEAQNQFKNVEIGSYPFFRLGKIGVSIVIRSTEKKQIDDCYKQIVSFLKKKEIHIIER